MKCQIFLFQDANYIRESHASHWWGHTLTNEDIQESDWANRTLCNNLNCDFIIVKSDFIKISLGGDHVTHLSVSASSSCRCSSVQGLKSKWVFEEEESCESEMEPSPSLTSAEEGSPPNPQSERCTLCQKKKSS